MTRDEWMASEWARCWPMLAPAVEMAGGTINRELLEADIAAGEAQFWPGQDFALVTGIVTHRAGLKECVVWFGGGNLDGLRKMRPAIRRFGQQNNCKRLAIYGRRGWLRAFPSLKEQMTIMVEDL